METKKQSLAEKMFAIQNLNLKYHKDATNPFFKQKYLSLDALMEVLRPELKDKRLLLIHRTENGEVITNILDLDSEDKMESRLPLPENIEPQKLGSAISYFRRYNILALLNVVADDDDGEATRPKAPVKQATSPVDKEDDSDLDF